MSRHLIILTHSQQLESTLSWFRQHKNILSHFSLLLGEEVYLNLKQEIHTQKISYKVVKSLSHDGDYLLSTKIMSGDVAGVFFFIEPERLWLEYPYFFNIIRACQNQNVPIFLNRASAELAIRGFSQSRVAYLIFNPAAGQGNPEQDLRLIRSILEPQILVNTIYTKRDIDPVQQAEDAVNIIQSKVEKGDRINDFIIASGGDGTVSAVASAVINTDIPLGIIPRGTANAFSVALGIPTNLRGACETIVNGNTRTVDTALCNDIPMILLAGIGFEAGMVDRAKRELKNRLGSLAYILAGAQQLAEHQLFSATIKIEDKVMEIETTAITVANVAPATSVLAQGFGEVIPDDGELEVTIATSKTPIEGLNAFASLFTSALVKKQTNREDLLCLRAKNLEIYFDSPQKLVVDGEMLETEYINFQCLSRSLTVYTPIYN